MEIIRRKQSTGTRLLSFVLNGEDFGIGILMVREIMGMSKLTQIPQTPDYIKGVINLRGRIIPIVDLRIKFKLAFKEYSDRTCIIFTEIKHADDSLLIGLVVDQIHEVINIEDNKISSIPYLNSKIKSDFIKGIAETDNSIIILLDIEKILTEKDSETLNKISQNTDSEIEEQ